MEEDEASSLLSPAKLLLLLRLLRLLRLFRTSLLLRWLLLKGRACWLLLLLLLLRLLWLLRLLRLRLHLVAVVHGLRGRCLERSRSLVAVCGVCHGRAVVLVGLRRGRARHTVRVRVVLLRLVVTLGVGRTVRVRRRVLLRWRVLLVHGLSLLLLLLIPASVLRLLAPLRGLWLLWLSLLRLLGTLAANVALVAALVLLLRGRLLWLLLLRLLLRLRWGVDGLLRVVLLDGRRGVSGASWSGGLVRRAKGREALRVRARGRRV